MESDWLRLAFIALLGGGVAGLIGFLRGLDVRAGATICEAGILLIGLFGVSSLLFGGLTFLTLFNVPSDPESNPWWVLPGLAVFALASFWLLADALQRKVSWDDNRLTLKRLTSNNLEYTWSDVSELKYNWFFQYHVLKFKDGTGFMLMEQMKGFQVLQLRVEKEIQSRLV